MRAAVLASGSSPVAQPGTSAQPAGHAGKYLAGPLDVAARKLGLLASQPDAVEQGAEAIKLFARKRNRGRTGRGSGIARPRGHGLRQQPRTVVNVCQTGREIEREVAAGDEAGPGRPDQLIHLVAVSAFHEQSSGTIESCRSDSRRVARARARFCRTAPARMPRWIAISAVVQPS